MRKFLLTFGGAALALVALLRNASAGAHTPLLDMSAVNVSDMLGDIRGGLGRGARLLDKADLTATWLGADHGAPGLSAFMDVQATDGTNFSGAVVGDAQSVSNLDGPAGLRLANAWVAKDFDGQGGIKAGIVDLNTEFDVQATAALFLNAAFGIGPDFSQSGQNGPSIFPDTGLGLVAWWLPGGHWTLKAGLFDGAPGDPAHPGRTVIAPSADKGALLVFEVRNHLTPDFVVGAGTWRYTASFDAIDPAMGRIAGNAGYYAIADGLLFSVTDDEKLSGWTRIGLADDRINAFQTAIGLGLVYGGPFGRKTDQVGLSMAQVRFGAAARRLALGGGDVLGAAETTFEATYSAAITEQLTLQPDLQYVVSPGGNRRLGNALVAGSRLTVSW